VGALPVVGGARDVMDEIDALVAERIGRKVRVAGACIGTDAHTVGIDAILNMKGYKAIRLERYREFETYNSAPVAVEELVALSKRGASTPARLAGVTQKAAT